MHTMRFADELVPVGEVEMPTSQRKPSKPEVSAARALLEQLSSSFQPQEYEDTYRAALLELIERKARGETIDAPEPEEIAPEDDLLGALQASIERVGRSHTSPAKAKAKAKGKRSKPKPGESRSGRGVVGSSRSATAGAGRTGKPAGSGH
jgi:DNA end-binding protein Ku